MTKTGIGGAAIRDLQTLLDAGAVGGLSDGQLLERFVATRDGAAFEALVVRHGPMVWGVCRRALDDHHDAQDAFQATFLVLARRAASVMPRGMVGNWLHGVACRTTMKAKSLRARRRSRERTVADVPETGTIPCPADNRLPLLDLELARLPRKYRIPIVLCDLEGTTQEEAARQVGCPVGTLSGRLWRGRSMLAKRLKRGILTPSFGSLAGLLASEAATASMPPSLVATSVTGAVSYAAHQAVSPALVSFEVVFLAEGVIKVMRFTPWKLAASILATLGVLGSWTVLMAYPPGPGSPKPEGGPGTAPASLGSVAHSIRRVAKAGPTLRGRVVDEAGQPLADARIVLYSGFATRMRGQEATTGKDGTYRFDPLKTGSMIKDKEAGRWDLNVGMQVFHPTHVSGDGLSWWDIRVPGVDGHEQVKDFAMVPGGTLDGRVLDADTGEALPGLNLRVQSPSPRSVKFGRYATTDKDGRFMLTALFPGEYVVDVNSPKLNYPVLGKVKIEAKKTAEGRYTMKGGLETQVAKVLDAHGGEAKLGSLRSFTETVRETPGDGKAMTKKNFIQLPDQYRCEIAYAGDDKTLICILTANGMRRWYKHPDGKTEEVLLGGRELSREYWLDALKFFGPRAVLRLGDSGHRTTLLAESKVGDRPAVAVRLHMVDTKVTDDRTMFFDKESGLLVMERSGPDGPETAFEDYKVFDGILVARKTTARVNQGKITTEGKVVDFKVMNKFDPALFQKP